MFSRKRGWRFFECSMVLALIAVVSSAVSAEVYVQGGMCYINGTFFDDTVYIEQVTEDTLYVNLNGQEFAGNVNLVPYGFEIQMSFGNDAVWIHPSVYQPTIIYLGWGNDYCDGGSGADCVYTGWFGSDEVHGNGGDDGLVADFLSSRNYLDGGEGDDWLISGIFSGWNTLVGGPGADTIDADLFWTWGDKIYATAQDLVSADWTDTVFEDP